MQIFDAHVSGSSHDAADWENLAYFGTSAALIVADAPGPFEVADDAIDALETVARNGTAAARAWGVRAGVALGIVPETTPARAHATLWSWLEAQASQRQTWALGALRRDGLSRGDSALQMQLEIAAASSLPVLVDVRGPHARRDVEWVLERGTVAGLAAAATVFIGVDYTCLRAIVDAGARGVIALGASGSPPDEAAQMVARFGAPACRSLMISSAASAGATDVLAAARFARALGSARVPQNEIDRVLWSNAVDVFRRARAADEPDLDQASK